MAENVKKNFKKCYGEKKHNLIHANIFQFNGFTLTYKMVNCGVELIIFSINNGSSLSDACVLSEKCLLRKKVTFQLCSRWKCLKDVK